MVFRLFSSRITMQLILPQGNLGSTVHCVSVKPGSGKENSFFLNTQKPHPKNPCRSICCDSSRRILESTAIPRNDPTKNPRLRFCSLGFSFCVSKLIGEADCALRNSRLVGGFWGDRGMAPEVPPGGMYREAVLATLQLWVAGAIGKGHIALIYRANFVFPFISYTQMRLNF